MQALLKWFSCANLSATMKENSFDVIVRFKMKTYLEIKQIRAYSLTNLVGNIGGYMGLFLGYAILNFPSLISKLLNSISKMVLRYNTKSYGGVDQENSSNTDTFKI